MIAMILIRNLHRDIMRYNRVPTDEEKAEEREETGWKVRFLQRAVVARGRIRWSRPEYLCRHETSSVLLPGQKGSTGSTTDHSPYSLVLRKISGWPLQVRFWLLHVMVVEFVLVVDGRTFVWPRK